MESYSFTTVCVQPDGSAATTVHLYPDGRASVWCSPGRERAQICLSHASATVYISPTNPTAPTAEDLAVARRLADLFARYAAEVERLHAAGSAESDGASDGAAA